MPRSAYILCRDAGGEVLTRRRIIDNTHLLDATEIFRKLNVHKKVRRPWQEEG
jgi:hypothetical protein